MTHRFLKSFLSSLPLLSLGLSLAFVGCDAGAGGSSDGLVREGDRWPDLIVRDCEGNDVAMRDFIAENAASYITFGAQWCSACQEEAPIINRELVDGLAGESLGIVQILIEAQPGQQPPLSLCSAWATELNARFAILVDTEQVHLPDFFGPAVATLPLHLIASQDGVIRYMKLGDLPSDIKGLVKGWLP